MNMAIHRVSLNGGDVGNRTRVRKISPTDFYERSRLFSLAGRSTAGKDSFQLAAEARKPLLCTCSDIACRIPTLLRPTLSPVGETG